jgi:hypothetical protein
MAVDLTPEEVMRHLTDVDYPADKDALLAAAERSGASDEVLRAIRAIPPSIDYRGKDEVVRSLHLAPAPNRPPGAAAEQARYDSKPGIAEHERDPQENRVAGADRRTV